MAGLIRVTEYGYEVASGACEDEEVPDEVGEFHPLPVVEKDACGVGEAAGDEPH
jgi:hypothetical protein